MSTEEKRGVLLVNLGSPDSYDPEDVRRYLHQFLMDKRVMDLLYIKRKILVDFVIIPRRYRESAAAYKSIWWKEGSPLIVLSRRVQKLLQEAVDMPVELAMRYGSPSCQAAIDRLYQLGVNQVLVIPLYPHYAMSSYETAVVEAEKALKKRKSIKHKVLPPFYDDARYIEALVASARPYLEKGFDHLLFSYHGLPVRHIEKADKSGKHCLKMENCCSVASPAHATCYRAQVMKTTQLFIEAAEIDESKCSVSFQSRLGRDPWLEPYTDRELERLGASGVEKLLVICPAFVADCLETLEEIAMAGKDGFLQAGGKEFEMIPCLNDHPKWIEVLTRWSTRGGL